jgi:arylsulfatase A-like enzyme
VTFDTTRADVLGCYGGRNTTSPRLDELAAGAFVFDSARTTAPLTTPAHLSMLTGLVPPRHAVRDNGYAPLPSTVATLAEAARAQGAATAAFVSAAVLDAAYGLARGFDVYDSPPLDAGATDLHVVERGADATLAAARAWLAARDREKPFFLWVHFYDPHAPYAPPDDLAQRAGSPYLGEIAAADRALGRAARRPARAGLARPHAGRRVRRSRRIAGQHGEPTHAALCYEPTIRVPLVVRPLGGVTPARRVAEAVSVVDVAPTIARALGAKLPNDVDGLDLLQPRPADRVTYFESYYGFLNHGWSPLAGVAGARGKLLVSNGVELYDTRGDAREKNDRSAERADDVAWLRAQLAAVAELPAHALDSRVTAEAVEAAARLGYAGGAATGTALPAPGAPSDRRLRARGWGSCARSTPRSRRSTPASAPTASSGCGSSRR